MITYITSLLQLKSNHRAVTAMDYGLIISLVALAITSLLGLLGTDL